VKPLIEQQASALDTSLQKSSLLWLEMISSLLDHIDDKNKKSKTRYFKSNIIQE
jgi:hypothetical protein